MQFLEPIENPLAVVLQGETTQLRSLTLQGHDRLAVIEGEGEIIAAASGSEVKGQLEIKLEPLPPLPLEGQHPDMGPQPQLAHNDAIVRKAIVRDNGAIRGRRGSCGCHNGRERWRKLRRPVA